MSLGVFLYYAWKVDNSNMLMALNAVATEWENLMEATMQKVKPFLDYMHHKKKQFSSIK